mgnify:CR=1 FL=1
MTHISIVEVSDIYHVWQLKTGNVFRYTHDNKLYMKDSTLRGAIDLDTGLGIKLGDNDCLELCKEYQVKAVFRK